MMAAEDIVVENMYAHAICCSEVGQERFSPRVAAVAVLTEEGGAHDLRRRRAVSAKNA